jgi:hypothetical protein
MTAEDLADLIQARRVRRRMWVANCPAHDDRDGLLRISHGFRGAVDIACRKRCSVYAIVEGLGIPFREVFAAPVAPAPDFAEMSDWEVTQYYSAQRERQEQYARACVRLSRQQKIVDEIRQQVAESETVDKQMELRIALRNATRRLGRLNQKRKRTSRLNAWATGILGRGKQPLPNGRGNWHREQTNGN